MDKPDDVLVIKGLFVREPGVAAVRHVRRSVRCAKIKRDGIEGSEEWHRKRETASMWDSAPQGAGRGERAILCQSSESEEELRMIFPKRVGTVPLVGENMHVSGLSVDKICIGDVFGVEGEASSMLFQISSPRKPCSTFDATNGKVFGYPFGEFGVRQYCSTRGTAGFFMRVLREGEICVGEKLILRERPHPGWTIRRVSKLIYDGATASYKTVSFGGTQSELSYLDSMQELAWIEWGEVARKLVEERLKRKLKLEHV